MQLRWNCRYQKIERESERWIYAPIQEAWWITSSDLLTSLSSSLDSIKASQSHHLFLPISFLTLIHASRVSHATTTLVPINTPLLLSTTFALILLFGGVLTASVLLAVPSPISLAPWTIAIYGLTHIVLTKFGISNFLLSVSKGSFGLTFDIFCHAIDGICRWVTGRTSFLHFFFFSCKNWFCCRLVLTDSLNLSPYCCRSEGIDLLGVESVRRHSNQAVANSPFAVSNAVTNQVPTFRSTDLLTICFQFKFFKQARGLPTISPTLISSNFLNLFHFFHFKYCTSTIPLTQANQ